MSSRSKRRGIAQQLITHCSTAPLGAAPLRRDAPLRGIAQHRATAQRYTASRSTAPHGTALHGIAPHCTPQHSTARHHASHRRIQQLANWRGIAPRRSTSAQFVAVYLFFA
jgi:hypothetical protein